MAETPQNQPDEALVDLLIKQVTEGLSAAEQRELDVLDSEVASQYLQDFERAAAAITLAGIRVSEPLPAALAQTLAQQARQHFASAQVAPATATATAVTDIAAARTATAARVPSQAGGANSRFAWLAAAACLILAIFGWVRTPAPTVAPVAEVVAPPPAPVEAPAVKPEPTPAEERAALMAKSESLKVTLGATKDPAGVGVTGDVVWDPTTQRGFLHFVGLAANDPAARQYQIWIFDGSRDKRYPIDGGVFDVPADATEVVIPIRASLMVRKPAAFAVSVEKSGGSVVSDRAHIVALGAAG